MSRLQTITAQAAAQQRKLLIPYLVAGDPDIATSLALMHELVRQGADIIELGFPFSDPTADGPVIQQGVARALAARVSLPDTLDLVQRFRQQQPTVGIVLMGYLNPIEMMGYQQFAAVASEAGVDGVLVVDMPPAESADLHHRLRAAGMDTIYLVAPTTTDDRVGEIIDHCSGYLYHVSLKGVTGAVLTDYQSVADTVNSLRQHTDLPIVIGFGIKDVKSARAMAEQADGIIIGSALVASIAGLAGSGTTDSVTLARTCGLIGAARKALDNPACQ